MLHRGTLDVKLSLPVPPNQQTPHAQDELYVVIRGRGVLIHNGERSPFEAGDLLFVAAAASITTRISRGSRVVADVLRRAGR